MVSHEKRHPFYVCDIFVTYNPILLNFWQKHTSENVKQTRMHSPPHLVLCVRTPPCKV